MSDYKQTRDAAGRVTSTFGKMLEGLTDDDLIDHIENLEKRLTRAYFKLDVLEDQIEEYRMALVGVADWADELGLYADAGHELHPVLKKVEEVLR